MDINLGDSIYKDIDKNQYLHELYESVLFNYATKIFSLKSQPLPININDALRFADILSKSTEPDLGDKHKLWAQEMVVLLHSLYPNNEDIRYFMGSILSTTANFRGLQLVSSKYKGETLLERLYNQYSKILLTVPQNPGEHFFFSQKKVFDSLDKDYFSYSGPTSMGKSYVIRAYIKEQILQGYQKNFAILVPTKALITEVSSKIIFDLQEALNENNYRLVNSAGATALEQEHNFIFVVTPERFLYLLISQPDIAIDFLFIDEAHKISSKDKRSAFYYKVIGMLSNSGNETSIIFASPNIPNPDVYLNLIPDLDNLESRQFASSYSPVSQVKFSIDTIDKEVKIFNDITEELSLITSIKQDTTLEEIIHLIGVGKQNIVYTNSRNKAVNFAREFAKPLKKLNLLELQQLAKNIREDVHGDYYLAELIEKGVAYHVGYLPSNIRIQIEKLYAEEKINTIFCTSTLVEGINLPADNLFVTSYKNGLSSMNEVEFKNLIGRVGRISYNLYGNVFLVRLQSGDKKTEFEELLTNEIPEQKLSVVTELSRNQKKKIVESLMNGSVEFLTYPKNQTADEFDLMRKFGLILLKDITEHKTSRVTEEFEKFITPEIEDKIRSAFNKANAPIDNNINLSIDQGINLREAIRDGLEYPKLSRTESDYRNLLSFLEQLCEIFKWEIYEKSTLGHVSKNGNHGLLRWYVVILLQWVQGNGLSFIINEAIKFKENNPNSGVWLNNQLIEYDYSREHKNIIIGETLSNIDNIILFKFANYFLKFSTEYMEQHNIKEMDNDWYEYVEYGTTNPLTILLQKSGFTRETSTYIRNHRDEYVIEIDGKPRLLKKILTSPNENVRRESEEIIFNAPELFIDS